MKKEKKPNQLLRHEREIRGWSQSKLAELIGADTSMISRWECGERKPEHFYREKLCTLLGRNAVELGFLEQERTKASDNILVNDTEELGFLEEPTNHVLPQRNSSSITSPITNTLTASPYFSFGHLETSWVVVEGDGTEEYTQKNIRSHFDPQPDRLPNDLAIRKAQIQKQQEENHRQGHPFQWNGERYSLDRFIISRSPIEEDMVLDLWFKPSDYYTFLATNQSLGDESLREKYLRGIDWQSPVRFFSNSFGVSLVTITSDYFTLFTQRGKNLGSRPGEFNISVSEGLSRTLDHSPHEQAPDIYRCASRGITEELGLYEPNDFRTSDIIMLSLGVDTHYSLWGLRGIISVNRTIEEIIKQWNSGVKDKLENTHIHPVKFEPNEIIPFIFSHEPWTPSALVCIYHALIHEYGHKRVDETIEAYSQQ